MLERVREPRTTCWNIVIEPRAMGAARLTLSQFVDKMRPRSISFRLVFIRRIHWGRADAASWFQSELAAGATVVQHPGALAVGSDFPCLVEQAPDRDGHRGQSRPDARDRGCLVILFPVVHRRGLPSRSAGPVQPQAPRRRAWSRLPILSRLGRGFSRREPSAHADLHELPSNGEAGQRGACTDSGKRSERPADALDSRSQPSRLRLLRS